MKYIITLLFVIFINGNAFACDCSRYDLNKEFENSEFVFKGKVKHTGSRQSSSGWINKTWTPYVLTEVVFDVKQSYKSNLNENITIYTNPESSACGFPFKEDEEYIVFTTICSKEYESYGFCIAEKPMVHSCSPTVHFNDESHEKERKNILKFINSL